MKKLILSLMLVFAFSMTAFAADTKDGIYDPIKEKNNIVVKM